MSILEFDKKFGWTAGVSTIVSMTLGPVGHAFLHVCSWTTSVQQNMAILENHLNYKDDPKNEKVLLPRSQYTAPSENKDHFF